MSGNESVDSVRALARQAVCLAVLAAFAVAAGAAGALTRGSAVVVAALAGGAALAEGSAAGALQRRAAAPTSERYRAGLARAIRRDIALERAQVRGRPPIARVLAEDAEVAERIARRLERARVDPRIVVEVRRLLEDGCPSRDRLRRVAFLVERDA
jgi:hypothetical protein